MYQDVKSMITIYKTGQSGTGDGLGSRMRVNVEVNSSSLITMQTQGQCLRSSIGGPMVNYI